MDFYQKLYRLRKEKGLTQEELAENFSHLFYKVGKEILIMLLPPVK